MITYQLIAKQAAKWDKENGWIFSPHEKESKEFSSEKEALENMNEFVSTFFKEKNIYEISINKFSEERFYVKEILLVDDLYFYNNCLINGYK